MSSSNNKWDFDWEENDQTTRREEKKKEIEIWTGAWGYVCVATEEKNETERERERKREEKKREPGKRREKKERTIFYWRLLFKS